MIVQLGGDGFSNAARQAQVMVKGLDGPMAGDASIIKNNTQTYFINQGPGQHS